MPGEFSVRGDLVDIFNSTNDQPFRLDFFDTELDDIYTFDRVVNLFPEEKSKEDAEKWFTAPDDSMIVELEEANNAIISDILGVAP